jgi:hypothetical protein
VWKKDAVLEAGEKAGRHYCTHVILARYRVRAPNARIQPMHASTPSRLAQT